MEFKKICINGISYGEINKGDANFLHDITAFTEVTNVDFRDGNLVNILKSSSHAETDNVRYRY